MVPAALVLLERLPLNNNGKVDRKQLPEPEFAATDAELIDAASATEKQLLRLVGQVFGRDCKNIGADFFSLGGSSLDAVRLIAEIRAGFAIDINVSAIFNAVNLRELATLLDQQIEAAGAPTEPTDLNSLCDKALDEYLQQLISEQGV
jgi:acyl carrier protein